jgi:hypothetical protein
VVTPLHAAASPAGHPGGAGPPSLRCGVADRPAHRPSG